MVASVGSGGTDGPADAAGGITDGATADGLAALGISIDKTLADNDAYHALKAWRADRHRPYRHQCQ